MKIRIESKRIELFIEAISLVKFHNDKKRSNGFTVNRLKVDET